MTDGEIAGNEILLLVDSGDVGFLDLLADDGDAVVVFLTLDGKVSRLVNAVQCNKSVWGLGAYDGDGDGDGGEGEVMVRRLECDLRCVQLQPCASRMGARP